MRSRRVGVSLFELMIVVAIIAAALAPMLGLSTLQRGLDGLLGGKRETTRTKASSVSLIRSSSPRHIMVDTSGFATFNSLLPAWKPSASLEEISKIWSGLAYREIAEIDRRLAGADMDEQARVLMLFMKASLLNSEGEAEKSYEVLEQLRSIVEGDPTIRQAARWLP